MILTRSRLLAAAVVAVPVLAVAVAPDSAATTDPHPTGWHVTAVTGTSLTVAMTAQADTVDYVVAATTDPRLLSVASLNGAAQPTVHRATSTSASVTVTLPYTTSPYYYRVGRTTPTSAGPYWSITASVLPTAIGLQPATPTGMTGHAGSDGTWLAWQAGAATGVQIDQARDANFTTSRHIYTAHSTTGRFTPYGLTVGATYWFRTRSLNTATGSGWSAAVALKQVSHDQAVRVMSFNVRSAALDGQLDGTARVSPWTSRVGAAASLVSRYHPDVIAVQEGNPVLGDPGKNYPSQTYAYPTWKIPARSPCNSKHYDDTFHYPYRQVDSLCDALRSTADYARALDGTPQHNGYGNYIIYNRAKLAMSGAGGFYLLPAGRYAAWQPLQVRASGVRMLVVSVHTDAALGATYDANRKAQVTSMISQAKATAARLGITRIVYAGDYNNYVGRSGVADVTTPVMHANGLPDSIENAQATLNTQYLCGNAYLRTPPHFATKAYACLDHVYVTPGIGVQGFGELLNLDSAGNWAGTIPSDHNAVFADLTLPY